ncbi:MAG: hypothetical protein ACI4UN_00090 [Muribaculaceae bacterium]
MEEKNDKQPIQPDSQKPAPAATDTPAVMKKIFGVFMLLIYFGMGGLTYCGYFDILFGEWHWMKWCLGTLFTVYGIWRAFRYFTGRN